MKYISINLLFLLLFAGCADKNAFSRFSMQKEQELSIVSLQNSKIKNNDDEIKGVISVVYLNDVYPKRYSNMESFYVYLYLNDKKDISNIDYMMKLNHKSALSIEKLPNINEFSKLISTKNRWNNYYLVKFDKDLSDTIEFRFENSDLHSNSMFYYKNEE